MITDIFSCLHIKSEIFLSSLQLVSWHNFSSRIIAGFNTFADTWFDEKQSIMHQRTKSTQHRAHSLTDCEAVWWCCCFESFWGLLQWDITTSWTYCTQNTVTPLGHQHGTIATSLILHLIRFYSISASKCLTSELVCSFPGTTKEDGSTQNKAREAPEHSEARLFWNRTQIIEIISVSGHLS